MARVSSILIYPDRDQPGQTLGTSYVSPEGLDGDRRKKSPVHLVAVENYIDFHPRANLVVDIRAPTSSTTWSADGCGSAPPSSRSPAWPATAPACTRRCRSPGDVSVGDEVLVGVPPE